MKQSGYMVDETRVKKYTDNDDGAGAVLYLMQRDQRVNDNWALLYAQQKAKEWNQSLVVMICIDSIFYPKTLRHYDFMMHGLQEVEQNLKKYSIPLYVTIGSLEKESLSFIKKYSIGLIVTDFNPLYDHQKALKKMIKSIVIPIYEVDAHNIVPCWITSQKQEYAARTIRPKIHKHLHHYVTEFPKVIKQAITWKHAVPSVDWKAIQKKLHLDMSILPVDWIKPGEKAGHVLLHHFIEHGLKKYGTLRNDPTEDAQSNMSPYIHFGHIAAQRIALEMSKVQGCKESKDAYLEELIVRKELTDNYCYYNEQYDSVVGAPQWAQETLRKHLHDKREYVYTKKQFEEAKTHDDLWNAAQIELVYHGKMHGYMRMYWAKKILEWTDSPEQAMNIAIYLNDTYSLDGTDPNGYVGIAWSISGVHDRAWFSRKVFGTIRYMSYNGCKSKFDIQKYIDIMHSIKK